MRRGAWRREFRRLYLRLFDKPICWLSLRRCRPTLRRDHLSRARRDSRGRRVFPDRRGRLGRRRLSEAANYSSSKRVERRCVFFGDHNSSMLLAPRTIQQVMERCAAISRLMRRDLRWLGGRGVQLALATSPQQGEGIRIPPYVSSRFICAKPMGPRLSALLCHSFRLKSAPADCFADSRASSQTRSPTL